MRLTVLDRPIQIENPSYLGEATGRLLELGLVRKVDLIFHESLITIQGSHVRAHGGSLSNRDVRLFSNTGTEIISHLIQGGTLTVESPGEPDTCLIVFQKLDAETPHPRIYCKIVLSDGTSNTISL